MLDESETILQNRESNLPMNQTHLVIWTALSPHKPLRQLLTWLGHCYPPVCTLAMSLISSWYLFFGSTVPSSVSFFKPDWIFSFFSWRVRLLSSFTDFDFFILSGVLASRIARLCMALWCSASYREKEKTVAGVPLVHTKLHSRNWGNKLTPLTTDRERAWNGQLSFHPEVIHLWSHTASEGFFPGLWGIIRRLGSTGCKILCFFPITFETWESFGFTWNPAWWML